MLRSILAASAFVATSSLAGAVVAATSYVAVDGDDAGDCRSETQPCKTIAKGIASLAGGDTLLIGDGTYAEPIDDMPSGAAGAYTTIAAKNDWGVVIDGSNFEGPFKNGITVESKHHVVVRGFRVRMNQDHQDNLPVQVPYSDHVKIQRCSGSYAPTSGNAASFSIGPSSSHVLVEECHAFGGGRYQFLVYQSDHAIVRRSVARHDDWEDVLECAGFTNYDSVNTGWQNNIVLDSDTANCAGRMFGGFFNENKDDTAPDTSEHLQGNIVLNVNAFYAGDLDWVASGTHTLEDMIIWGSSGGYWGDQGPGDDASIRASHMTLGGITGKYDGPNGGAAHGTGFCVFGDVDNGLTSSILTQDASLGVADYTSSDYNAFSSNGANYGGSAHQATPGQHDRTGDVVSKSLKYLPRIEAGSPLASAGEDGLQIGADVTTMIGRTGSLQDDDGWDQPTGELLWPFPNEDVIREDMASYDGPGGVGARGFATGSSLDGSPQTLTKYVWEYLGNTIPADVYGFHIDVGALPNGVVGEAYAATLHAVGGDAPIAWRLDGKLPPGIAFDAGKGAFSGTPKAVGISTLTVTATDASAPKQTAMKTYHLTITLHGTGGGGGGGSSGDGESDDAGCGCRFAEPAPSLAWAACVGAAALAAARRRRRR